MNCVILLFHVATICGLTLATLRFGKEFLIAWLSILSVAMNLFILKQITLFGLSVTSSDALAVGYLLGLNLIQEFFGKKIARKTIWISFFTSSAFVFLSQIALFYLPNEYDLAQSHFLFLFTPMPRIVLASLFSFLAIQLIDISFFGYLAKRTGGKYLTGRISASLLLSQTLDTLLFSFLGLFGVVEKLGHVIVLSLAIKGIVILISTPFVFISKKFVAHEI